MNGETYAAEKAQGGRVQLIREGKDDAGKTRFKRLDMTRGLARQKVLQAVNNAELDHIFDTEEFFE